MFQLKGDILLILIIQLVLIFLQASSFITWPLVFIYAPVLIYITLTACVVVISIIVMILRAQQ